MDMMSIRRAVVSNQIALVSKSGNPVSFRSVSTQMPSCAVNIEPNQDLHGYDSPWPGGGGKNLFNPAWFVDRTAAGITSAVQADETIHMSGTATNANRYAQSSEFMVLPAGTYTVKGSPHAVTVRQGSTRVDSNYVFTSDGTTPLNIAVSFSSGSTYDIYEKIWIEAGSTSGTWTPYENVCPISGYTQGHLTRCGTNVWDEQWKAGHIVAGQEVSDSNYRLISKNYIHVMPGETYYIVRPDSGITLYGYDSYKNYLRVVMDVQASGTHLLDVPADVCYVKIQMYAAYGSTSDLTYRNDIGINYPSTATSYEPYNNLPFGKNLLNESEIIQGGIAENGTISTSELRRVVSGLIPVTANTQYVASIETGKAFVAMRSYDAGGNAIESGNVTLNPFTTANGAKYIRVMFKNSDNSNITPSSVTNAQLEKGSSASEHEPYCSNPCLLFATNLLKSVSKTNGYFLNASGVTGTDENFCYTDLIPVEVGKKYNFTGKSTISSASNRRIHEYNSSGEWVRQAAYQNVDANALYSLSVTIPNGTAYLKVSYGVNDENAELVRDGLGTVYGGTLNVLTGVLTVDRTTHTFDGTENILLNATAGKFKLPNYYGWKRQVDGGQGMSNMLKRANSGGYNFALSDNIYFEWQECSNATAMKAKLAELYNAGTPLVISYKVTTPTTYQLTPHQITALIGQNNIWTDTKGNINVQYYGA